MRKKKVLTGVIIGIIILVGFIAIPELLTQTSVDEFGTITKSLETPFGNSYSVHVKDGMGVKDNTP